MVEVYNVNNQKIICEILFTFTKNNKNFIVYKDKDEEILAAYYKEENNQLIIMPIINDKDFDLVDKELENWWNDYE